MKQIQIHSYLSSRAACISIFYEADTISRKQASERAKLDAMSQNLSKLKSNFESLCGSIIMVSFVSIENLRASFLSQILILSRVCFSFGLSESCYRINAHQSELSETLGAPINLETLKRDFERVQEQLDARVSSILALFPHVTFLLFHSTRFHAPFVSRVDFRYILFHFGLRTESPRLPKQKAISMKRVGRSPTSVVRKTRKRSKSRYLRKK